jgi:hypothetical protein
MLVAWFMLGFAFYSLLYGSLGSLASRTEDAQAAAGPVIAVLMIIYLLAFVAVANPAAGWVTIVSMLPPSAPMIMPLRVALVNVPAWQLALAVVFMLGGIYGLFRAGARLYQIRYTMPPTVILVRSPSTSGIRPTSSPWSSQHTIAVLPIPPRPTTLTSRIPGSVTYRASRPVSTCRS